MTHSPAVLRVPSVALPTLLMLVASILTGPGLSLAEEPATRPAAPVRSFAAPILSSSALPAIRLRIDPQFEYLGNTDFILMDKARVDRHHFVSRTGNQVERMIVVHFEGFIDADSTYRGRRIPEPLAGGNYRFSPAPIQLGQGSYVHNTWCFSAASSAKERPDGESARTQALLAARGLSFADELCMSRFDRVVGVDRRNELLIFYFERLADHGLTLDALPEESPPSAAFDRLSAALTTRSLASFEVVDE